MGISARLRLSRSLSAAISMPVTLAWARRSVSGPGGGLPSSILWVSSRRSRYASTHDDRDASRCISASEYSSSRPASSTSSEKTWLVTSASPSALCGLSWEIPSVAAIFASEYSHDGLSTYASSRVSARGPANLTPLAARNPRSKSTLCPTMGSPPTKDSSPPATFENGGAASTSAWLMPVYRLMKAPSSRFGFTSEWKVSRVSVPLNLTAPISMISSSSGESPVVSTSSATHSSSSGWVPASNKEAVDGSALGGSGSVNAVWERYPIPQFWGKIEMGTLQFQRKGHPGLLTVTGSGAPPIVFPRVVPVKRLF